MEMAHFKSFINVFIREKSNPSVRFRKNHRIKFDDLCEIMNTCAELYQSILCCRSADSIVVLKIQNTTSICWPVSRGQNI